LEGFAGALSIPTGMDGFWVIRVLGLDRQVLRVNGMIHGLRTRVRREVQALESRLRLSRSSSRSSSLGMDTFHCLAERLLASTRRFLE
jgi:hypothetical protein